MVIDQWVSCLSLFVERKELLDELSSMPIRNDTLRIRTKREELEQKLDKVEEAMKIFSRKKVFVKLDLWLDAYAVAVTRCFLVANISTVVLARFASRIITMVPTVRGFSVGILRSHKSHGKSGKMERVREKSGNFRSTTLQKSKSIFKIIKRPTLY